MNNNIIMKRKKKDYHNEMKNNEFQCKKIKKSTKIII